MFSAKLFGIHMDVRYGLYLEDYTIPGPEVQTDYVDIPYRDGAIDKTAPDGVVRYKNREWDLKFKKTGPNVSAYDLPEISERLMNGIHGRSGEIIFDDDVNYKWIGRAFVGNVTCENNGLIIAPIKLITEPYKRGVIDIVEKYNVSETESDIVLKNGRKPIIPKIIVSDNAQLKFVINNVQKTLNLSQGTYVNSDLVLFEGENIVTVSGDGYVQFEYQEMSL